MKDEFFSLAAHEIRTPITVIKAQAQLAERFHSQGKLSGELMEKTLRIFVQESDRLARLCNDLLDIARIDTNCFEVHLSTFDLVEVIREGVLKVTPKSPTHRLVFEPGPAAVDDHGKLLVHADRDRVHHILGNILNNAIRYSPQGGDVTITLERTASKALVSIRDHGLGIAPERLNNIFERYYQAHQTGLKGPCGLGLGLYLCREALIRMNGEIHVASAGPGHGAEFTFTLPTGVSS